MLRYPLALLVLLGCAMVVRADDKPLRERIDADVKAAWQKQKLTPAGRADDATFLRRVYLDLVGTVPTTDEASKFAADTPWVHLDIAGTSWYDDPQPHAPKGSTGTGVKTLVELACN